MAARAAGQEVNTAPERTDGTDMAALMEKPVAEVKAEAVAEFKAAGYGADLEAMGVAGVVDKVNKRGRKSKRVEN